MQSSVATAFDQHPEILRIERDSDGRVVVNGFRQDELRVPDLTVWQSRAEQIYSAAKRELEARGIFCDGFVLWRN